MDDVESQIPDEGHEMNAARRCQLWHVLVLSLLLSAVIIAGIIVPIEYYRVCVRYSVAVDSISGVDPKAGLSFNIILGVASRSYGSEACIYTGTSMEVSYRGVQLAAASAAETGWLCARPRKAEKKHVLAMATAVPAGNVLKDLTADMKTGTAVFDVRLHVPGGSYGDESPYAWVSDCKGVRVGQGAVTCEPPDQRLTALFS